jgi:hypothetical protein
MDARCSTLYTPFFPCTVYHTATYMRTGVVVHCSRLELSMTLHLFVGLWPLFQFLDFYIVGSTPWAGNQPVARPLPAHRTTQPQTFMPQVRFEPTITASEQANTVRDLDCAATVTEVTGCLNEISLGLLVPLVTGEFTFFLS